MNKEQEIFNKANRAEALLKSKDFKVVSEYVKKGKEQIEALLSGGLTSDSPEEGGKTWQEKYWDYVGEHRALSSIEPYLNRLIAKRDAIIKKRDASEGKEASGE